MDQNQTKYLDLSGLRIYDTQLKAWILQNLGQPSDWNEVDTASPNYIANKPTIPSNTSDLTNDSGFITLADVPEPLKADWNESNSSSLAYIENKTHWIERTLDQSSVVNFYLIKEAEDQTVLADRDDDQKQTTTAEMVGDDYGAFLTYEVGNPSRGKTNPQMENTVVSVTVAGTTYTATPNFIGTQSPIDPEDDPTRYYTIGNYNLFYSRCDTNPEVSDTPDGPASITDASQANWPFCIWFITERPARYPAYITIIGFETGTSGYTILGDDEYTIPITITNVNSTYHPLDARYIPAAQAIAAGDNGYTTGAQVYAAIAGLNGAMHFKGVIAGAASLPNAPEVGDVYIASAAFTFGQEPVEAGDMFVYSNTGWKIIQGNISMAAIQQMIADASPAVISESDINTVLGIPDEEESGD